MWTFFLHSSGALFSDPPLNFQEAVEQITALRQLVTELQLSLHQCTLLTQRLRGASMSRDEERNLDEAKRVEGDANWHVDEGPCLLEDDCITSPNFPDNYNGGERCVITIDSNWTGVLDLRAFSVNLDQDFLTVNGASYSDSYTITHARMQGTVPTRSLEWSSSPTPYSGEGGSWQLCRSTDVNLTMTAKGEVLWAVVEGLCEVDVDGCVVSPNFPGTYNSQDSCTVVVDEAWLGGLEVGRFDTEYGRDVLYVNNHSISGTMFGVGGASIFELRSMTPSGTIVWTTNAEVEGGGWKLCPSGEVVQHPWSGEVWTCKHTGEPCEFPFYFLGNSFDACTAYLSDMHDVDDDGDHHDGFSRCADVFHTASNAPQIPPMVACGPCSCGAGEEQGYLSYSLAAHGEESYISCAPCAPGRFKSMGGYGAEAACSACPPGSASVAGATACDACGVGFFSVGGVECSACPPGSFGSEVQQSVCQACAVGHFAGDRAQTACSGCTAGTVTPDKNSSGCAQCVPGRFAGNDSMTSCELCTEGSFSESWGNAVCRECSVTLNPGGPNANLWVTARQVLWKGRLEWTTFDGANTSKACGCAEGSWKTTAGECHTCGEGAICSGMGVVEVKYGYFAAHDNAGFVWRCHGRDQGRCPGGVPGRCAENRQNTSVACGDCAPGTRMTTEGPCVACDAGNDWLLALAVLICLCLLGGVYYAIVNENRAKETEAVALLAIMGSQMFTMLQMMGVLDTLAVQWPEPFASILDVASLLNFRVEVLNMGCVFPLSALTRYVTTAFGFFLLLLAMFVFHLLHMLVFHWHKFVTAQFKEFTPALIGAVGSIFMLGFISVTSAIVAPFQCDVHPNGEFTVHAYPQVICWNTDHGKEHQNMVIAGLCASLVPLGFLAMCFWVVRSLPSRFGQGDGAFLHAFAFLFFRFRPGSYRYIFVLVARGTCMALVPTLTDDFLELFAVAVILLPCVVVSSVVGLWRVRKASMLDIAINGGVLLLAFLGALFLDTTNKTLIADVLLVVVSFLLSLLICSACNCFLSFSKRWRRTYAFFLCHHKEGGGCFARLLKMCLKQHPQVTREVFLDSDNLQDLSALFGTVGNRVDTLVVLCTKDVLSRLWCLGEMATARAHKLNVLLVIFPEFRWPSKQFVSDFGLHVEGLESLVHCGISLDMILATLKWLPGFPQITLPKSMTLACVVIVVDMLIARKGGNCDGANVPGIVSENARGGEAARQRMQLLTDGRPPLSCQVVSVVDHSNSEAVCTAHILRELLTTHCPLMTKVPHVIGADEHVADDVHMVLMICSNGCFRRGCFVRQVVEAAALGARILPILVEEGCHIPQDWHTECQELASRTDAGDVAVMMESIFKTIAVSEHVQDSDEVLDLRAGTICEAPQHRHGRSYEQWRQGVIETDVR